MGIGIETLYDANRAYFALYPGGTSSLEQTTVPLAAYSLKTVYLGKFAFFFPFFA